jgi:hypothetical protein
VRKVPYKVGRAEQQRAKRARKKKRARSHASLHKTQSHARSFRGCERECAAGGGRVVYCE